MLDLDALKPATVSVRIKGTDYEVPSTAGLPVKAILDGMQLARLTGEAQTAAMLDFITRWGGLPRAVVEELTGEQLRALMSVWAPTEVAPVADPPRTANGVDGKVLQQRIGISTSTTLP